MMPFPFDLQQTLQDAVEMNKKLLKGMNTLLSVREIEVAVTPKELVYEEDKMKLYHYRPVAEDVVPVPALIVYALVNRQYMMDLQSDRSVIRNWLELGLDVYVIDWGYPDQSDKFLTMEDYIDGYLNNAVDAIRKHRGLDRINILGVCQGGTFSTIYAALYPEKVQNLVTMVTPIDFDIKDSALFTWGKHMNVDDLVDAYGVVPGDFLNLGFLLLKPFQLSMDKYLKFIDSLDSPQAVQDFLRMEKWIFDSPALAGEALRKFVKDLY
ncbi:MAG: alpha/beta fold hydrolase, partial [Syntrophomonadaceae bacterium]|nr:alpha/beta fold hydrolase [Syntrophomonadaceae bacterium]